MAKLLSKFTRIAVEGDTTDGRVIEKSWIQQMAKNYSAVKYGARIWLEHIRSVLPDSQFKAYGDVVAVKAEEVTIDGEKKLALFAQLAPTPELVAMNQARQKLYTSIEIDPNFAKSGECYLVGLAVTDSPASLGTEMLEFASKAGDKNPLNGKKQKADNLFTAATEVAFEFEEEDEKPQGNGQSFFDKIMAKLKGDKKEFSANLTDTQEAVEAIAGSQRDLLDKYAADNQALRKDISELAGKVKKTEEDFTAFRTKVEGTENPDNKQRPPASGGDAALTDC